MRRLLFLFLPLLNWAQSTLPQPDCSETYYRFVITALANDSMEGRLPGTEAEKKSAGFIARELERMNCQPLFKKDYFTPFTYINPDSVLTRSAGNVVATIESKNRACVVIGAHYDHLGMGRHHSRAPFTQAIHNGADDNASGVAMMLSLADWCRQNKNSLPYSVILIAYSGEEDGLWGSKYFLDSGLTDTSAIYCYINLDMVGRLNTANPILKTEGLPEYPELAAWLMPDSLAGFSVRKCDPILKDGSDNYTFETHRIKGLSFTTGLTEQYHRPEDDADRINYSGMVQISRYLRHLLLQITPQP